MRPSISSGDHDPEHDAGALGADAYEIGRAISPNEPPEGGDIVQIQVNTDDNIEGRDALTAQVEADIRDGLSRFADQITRVEVHLSDENAGKGGNDDMRCLLEVRPSGQQPVVVTDQGGTLQEATAGAVQKMQHKLQSTFGRQNNAKGGHSIRDLETL